MNNTQSTKTIKDFEEKLNVNPEFFGLFREELLNLNTENINFDTTEDAPKTFLNNDFDKNTIGTKDTKDTNEEKENNNIEKKEDISTKDNQLLKDKTKSKSKSKSKKNSEKKLEKKTESINKRINIINDLTQEDLNTRIELENIKKEKNLSSTTVCFDDLKNLKLEKYELYKLEEIIKYFYLYEKK